MIVIKDLKVKGASSPLKAGTKVKKIRLVEGDHDIDCNRRLRCHAAKVGVREKGLSARGGARAAMAWTASAKG
ncbi:MAG TPA: PhnA domain-containing protein [Labilithrix sp.]|nr:PhnA domain-containing protein [Labilithrix sp.]